ncbi:hypothetical protein V8E55_011924 [Tylopilus felleus]
MLNNVNALPRSNAYPNCSSLIQSSGYGKSRLMDELVKLVYHDPVQYPEPGRAQQSVWHVCIFIMHSGAIRGGLSASRS